MISLSWDLRRGPRSRSPARVTAAGDPASETDTMILDIDFVRSQFPGLAGEWILMDNAGGSQILGSAADRIRDYLLRTNVQLGATYAVSEQAGELVRAGRAAAATLFNAARAEDVALGASTTALLRALAESLRSELTPGDEVVVTNVDHEANIGPWVRLAERGVEVRVWSIRPDTFELRLEDLERVMTARTRLVCFTHVSNILGTLNPVEEIIRRVQDRGARVCIDGVAHAPHRAIDVRALNADFYVASFYKIYGPHLAALYVRPDHQERLENLNHYFLGGAFPACLEPGSVNYELTAGLPAIVDYLGALAERSGGGPAETSRKRVELAFEAIAAHEAKLEARLLGYLDAKSNVRIIGRTSSDPSLRVPTVSFVVDGVDSSAVPLHLDTRRIAVRYGHFYARRLIDDLGLAARNGVVRVSLVHYNTLEEVEALIAGLEEIL